ncbi:MAG: peptide deformylase [Alphaproteobacteria bacterium]
MTVRTILTAPDPILAKVSKPVAKVDDSVRRLMDDMLETMSAADGIGLAAPQIGVLKRVVVIDVSRKGEAMKPLKMANPPIIAASDEDFDYEEGCLSVPEHYAEVTRPARVTVRYLDDQNEIRELKAEGVLSVCVQHEIDHLDGVLFIDRISALRRNMILRKLIKARKQTAAEAV